MIKVYFDRRRCLGCRSCVFACAVEHSQSKNPLCAHREAQLPVARRNIVMAEGMNITVSCRHCEPAPCVAACIAGAMRKEGGETRCDAEKCVGCGMCVMVCPFDAVQPGKISSIKCDLCGQRDDSYACVEACPTRALFTATPEEFRKTRESKQPQEKVGLLT